MSNYFSIKVPRILADRVKDIAVKNGTYRTVSEFVLESTRLRLEGINPKATS